MTTASPKSTVGVLGGMGPFATLAFYKRLLELTPASKDWDHVRVILDVNPHIPSRSRHCIYGEKSPVVGMLDSCLRLSRYPVDFIVIPCNSACYYIPEIQPSLTVPLWNIMEVTASALAGRAAPSSRVGVLGGVVTYQKRAYEPFLAAHGLNYVHHSTKLQKRSEELIERIKSNERSSFLKEELCVLINRLASESGADAVILGCTEFCCIDKPSLNICVVDSSEELALATVRQAKL